ncbi:MAG: hypothetical protein P1P85_05490 [Patescibacteria group bacterium]|nr:hypothetical protein [Patescibacteria group bacterium]
MKCKNCEKIEKLKPSVDLKRRFCSISCSNKFRHKQDNEKLKNRNDEILNLFRSGKSFKTIANRFNLEIATITLIIKKLKTKEDEEIKCLYGKGWTDILKISIKARDKYLCQKCRDETNNLVVHYKDFNTKNHNPNNLITLCKKCHRQLHGNN